MAEIILAIHTIIVLGLVGVVLLQRSEGGALGMGGGGGGFMSGRGAANALTKSTTILAALFFTSSLGLALIGDRGTDQNEILRDLTGEEVTGPQVPGEIDQDDVLDFLGEDRAPEAVPAPASEVAPVPAPEEAPASEEPGTDE